jgi:Dolichyl-phosphate-mannose-protein mannosyltransferase
MNHSGGSGEVTAAAHGALPAGNLAASSAPQAPRSRPPDRLPLLAWVVAAAFVALELAVSARYGFLQDELYFIEAGRHLTFGYVDQPPLMPLLDKVTDILGVTPTAVRIIPALAGGAVIITAARLAALFGAGRFGRVLAAVATACAPVLMGAMHIGNTTPIELLAWSVVVLCVATALLRDRPRWWLGAGAAAGIGLEDNNLLVLLLIGLAVGILATCHRPALRTRWPWLGAAIALVIWTPNLIWQATHGWPQLAMASALHQENSSVADYAGGLPAQLVYAGLLTAPLLIAGYIRLWRAPQLRFIAIVVTITAGYVLAWIPGRTYYADGLLAVVLAAGSVAAERWIARARRPRLRGWLVVVPVLAGMAAILPFNVPLLPVTDVHSMPLSIQRSSGMGDTVGWPQLTRAIAAQDAALKAGGTPPTSIFTGYYAEAAALNVLGTSDHLPPVLSGHNAYWMWGPGRASDRTVLVVDAIGQLRRYFASCRLLTRYRAPFRVRNDWTGIPIGVCTGPVAGWHALWPHLRHYG